MVWHPFLMSVPHRAQNNSFNTKPHLFAGTSDEQTCCLQDKINLEEIIDRLLDVRNGRPGKQVQLTEQEIKQLCLTSKEIFMQQPNLLELEAPIKICGRQRRNRILLSAVLWQADRYQTVLAVQVIFMASTLTS